MLAVASALAARADASHGQIAIIQDDVRLIANPAATLQAARNLGAGDMRLIARWETISPSPNARSEPKGFNPSNPASYPASAWAPYDTLLKDAAALGITIDFDVAGNPPLWATGPGAPAVPAGQQPHHNWEPSAVQFGYFMHALGERYSGNYDPLTNTLDPGNPDDLPRVSFWTIWNEPDYGPSLAPQALPGYKNVPDAPRMYRALIDAGWASLQATGHKPSTDTILIGELAPRGDVNFGNFDGMLALPFVQALYCVNSSYQPLSGFYAALLGCPTTARASARFASQNPGLFGVTGFSDHPYEVYFQPNQEINYGLNTNTGQLQIPEYVWTSEYLPNYTSLATIGHLETALNGAMAAYGSKRVIPIYSTEFGYKTSPPTRRTKVDPYPWLSPATAAYYDNWAEYISWKNPRIASFAQYLIQDTVKPAASNDWGGYDSGLINWGGTPKASYYAWRLPLYLPSTSTTSGRALEVWGGARPAHFALLDFPYSQQNVSVLFAPTGSRKFTAIATVPITASNGYFDTHVVFPRSGTVELSWTYPQDSLLHGSGTTAYSRQVQVTVS